MADLEMLEPAHTSFTDWVGTAAAETSFVKASDDLYELAGLKEDRDRWTILGFQAHAFSHGSDPRWTVDVYALDTQAHPVDGYEGLRALEAQLGSVPVRQILCHDVTLDDVIRCLKSIDIQLLSHNFTNLHIEERGDHPEQT